MTEKKIKITKDGPYLVSGSIPLEKEIIISDKNGVPGKWKAGEKYPLQKNYALCRCGKSKNMPYCEGSHIKIKFNGAETASKSKYSDLAEHINGPELILDDVEELCSVARFCHRGGSTWALADMSDDPKSKEKAIQNACDCPSGRLLAREKNGKPIEPKFKQSISLIEDSFRKQSGPVWVKGEIEIESADGTTYEVRNRVTLCRCGKSKNKPFCDGTHCIVNFQDGDLFEENPVEEQVKGRR